MAIFKNVCIIDDDDLFLIVTKAIMEDENFAEKIHSYDDVRVALERLNSIEMKDVPELLLLDINMPMMDGWEFMDKIQEMGMHNKMQIYITSSSINPDDLKKAEENKAISGFLSKPLDPKKLKLISKK